MNKIFGKDYNTLYKTIINKQMDREKLEFYLYKNNFSFYKYGNVSNKIIPIYNTKNFDTALIFVKPINEKTFEIWELQNTTEGKYYAIESEKKRLKEQGIETDLGQLF